MSELIERFESNLVNNETNDSDAEIDELLEELELENESNDINDESEVFKRYREQRMQDISDHLKEVEKNVIDEGYGQLETIDNEKEIINLTTKHKRTAISFIIPNFPKCQYMNGKLNTLSKKHLSTKFLTINVEKCPFLVSKLNIKVLPFVVGYVNGVEILRIVGFSLLGNNPHEFKTDALEKLLYTNNLIEKMSGISTHINIKSIKKTIRSSADNNDNDSDSGLDI